MIKVGNLGYSLNSGVYFHTVPNLIESALKQVNIVEFVEFNGELQRGL
jgi:hypothetical protein